MRKIVFALLVLLSLVVLGFRFFSTPLLEQLGFQTKAGLQVMSEPSGAQVFLNDTEVGVTPYRDENLSAGDYRFKLVLGELIWQGRVRLNTGTLSVVNRELNQEASASSGETLTLTAGRGVVLTSLPSGADIILDGETVGQTPLALPEIAAGEHVFLFDRQGHIKRSLRAVLPPDLTLNIAVDLAIQEPEPTISPLPAVTLPIVVVKETPTGFLKVREKPSTASLEIARVVPGDKLRVLEEQGSWVKVRLPGGVEGYVSAAYVEKI